MINLSPEKESLTLETGVAVGVVVSEDPLVKEDTDTEKAEREVIVAEAIVKVASAEVGVTVKADIVVVGVMAKEDIVEVEEMEKVATVEAAGRAMGNTEEQGEVQDSEVMENTAEEAVVAIMGVTMPMEVFPLRQCQDPKKTVGELSQSNLVLVVAFSLEVVEVRSCSLQT